MHDVKHEKQSGSNNMQHDLQIAWHAQGLACMQGPASGEGCHCFSARALLHCHRGTCMWRTPHSGVHAACTATVPLENSHYECSQVTTNSPSSLRCNVTTTEVHQCTGLAARTYMLVRKLSVAPLLLQTQVSRCRDAAFSCTAQPCMLQQSVHLITWSLQQRLPAQLSTLLPEEEVSSAEVGVERNT
jgi:hypothetical protein